MTNEPNIPATDLADDTTPVKFDHRRYLIAIKGNREYLPVAARVLWFRMEHPDWSITTNPVKIILNPEHGSPYAIFHAAILNAEGKIVATAHKMCYFSAFADFLEKAETGAVGRALALAGFGTQFAPEMDEEGTFVDTPRTVNARPTYTQARTNPRPTNARAASQGTKRQTPPADDYDAIPPISDDPEPERAAPTAVPMATADDRPARQAAYDDFAAAAYRLGFDVTVSVRGEPQYSFMKIGPLLAKVAGIAPPARWKDWLPAVDIVNRAIDRLPDLANARAMTAPEPVTAGMEAR